MASLTIHFVQPPLTVDDIFCSVEILRLVAPMALNPNTGILWASESDLFFHKCLKKQSAFLSEDFFTPVAMEVIRTPEIKFVAKGVNTSANILVPT